MSVCPSCALAMPRHARFCGRCGTRLPEPPAGSVPVWAIVVLALGAAFAALVAGSYAILLVAPDLATSGGTKLDPGQVRLSAGLLVTGGLIMFGLQLAALIGLVLGRQWARVLGTLAAAGWALTCLGLPLAALLLHLVWRRPVRSAGLSPNRWGS